MSFSMDIIRKSKNMSLPSSKSESVQYKDSYDKFEDVLETVLQENRVFNITMIQEGIFLFKENDDMDVDVTKIAIQVLGWFEEKINEKYESFCRMIDFFNTLNSYKGREPDPSIMIVMPDYIRYSYGERYNSSSYLKYITANFNSNMVNLKRSGSLSQYSATIINLMKDHAEDTTLDKLRSCLAGDPVSTMTPNEFQGKLAQSFRTEHHVSYEVSIRDIYEIYFNMVSTIKPAINRIKEKLLHDADAAGDYIADINLDDFIPENIPDDTKWLTKSYAASKCNDLKEACMIYYIYFCTLCDTAEEEMRMYWRALSDNKEVL